MAAATLVVLHEMAVMAKMSQQFGYHQVKVEKVVAAGAIRDDDLGGGVMDETW
jgi:hypothetical protein